MPALLLAAVLAAASPAPSPCPGADIAVTDLKMSVVKGPAEDRVLITADLTNVGQQAQRPNIQQRAELLRDGRVLARQPLPALAAGVTYPLQFRIFRSSSARKDPLMVLVRYVPLSGDADAPSCPRANDSLQKTF